MVLLLYFRDARTNRAQSLPVGPFKKTNFILLITVYKDHTFL